jgi:hypothetical protein
MHKHLLFAALAGLCIVSTACSKGEDQSEKPVDTTTTAMTTQEPASAEPAAVSADQASAPAQVVDNPGTAGSVAQTTTESGTTTTTTPDQPQPQPQPVDQNPGVSGESQMQPEAAPSSMAPATPGSSDNTSPGYVAPSSTDNVNANGSAVDQSGTTTEQTTTQSTTTTQ